MQNLDEESSDNKLTLSYPVFDNYVINTCNTLKEKPKQQDKLIEMMKQQEAERLLAMQISSKVNVISIKSEMCNSQLLDDFNLIKKKSKMVQSNETLKLSVQNQNIAASQNKSEQEQRSASGKLSQSTNQQIKKVYTQAEVQQLQDINKQLIKELKGLKSQCTKLGAEIIQERQDKEPLQREVILLKQLEKRQRTLESEYSIGKLQLKIQEKDAEIEMLRKQVSAALKRFDDLEASFRTATISIKEENKEKVKDLKSTLLQYQDQTAKKDAKLEFYQKMEIESRIHEEKLKREQKAEIEKVRQHYQQKEQEQSVEILGLQMQLDAFRGYNQMINKNVSSKEIYEVLAEKENKLALTDLDLQKSQIRCKALENEVAQLKEEVARLFQNE